MYNVCVFSYCFLAHVSKKPYLCITIIIIITITTVTAMTKDYYKNEYTEKQWKALIDEAEELGCRVTYSKYGNIATVDSTDKESAIIAQTGRGEQDRAMWAEHIHNTLQESTDLRKWKVQPKRYRKGYCPTTCMSQKSAEHERERLEMITGFEWTITVIPE